MKFINTDRSTNKKNINIIVLFFIALALSGIILSSKNAENANKKTKNENGKITVSDLKKITNDSTIKNIDVDYRILKTNTDSLQINSFTTNANYYTDFYKMLSIIIIVLFLILLGLYFYRKSNKYKINDDMGFEILGRRYLGQKQYVALIKIKNSTLLLGVTDNSINLIKEYQNEEEIDSKEDTNENETFPKILKNIKNDDE